MPFYAWLPDCTTISSFSLDDLLEIMAKVGCDHGCDVPNELHMIGRASRPFVVLQQFSTGKTLLATEERLTPNKRPLTTSTAGDDSDVFLVIRQTSPPEPSYQLVIKRLEHWGAATYGSRNKLGHFIRKRRVLSPVSRFAVSFGRPNNAPITVVQPTSPSLRRLVGPRIRTPRQSSLVLCRSHWESELCMWIYESDVGTTCDRTFEYPLHSSRGMSLVYCTFQPSVFHYVRLVSDLLDKWSSWLWQALFETAPVRYCSLTKPFITGRVTERECMLVVSGKLSSIFPSLICFSEGRIITNYRQQSLQRFKHNEVKGRKK